jgi:hypothetical protein
MVEVELAEKGQCAEELRMFLRNRWPNCVLSRNLRETFLFLKKNQRFQVKVLLCQKHFLSKASTLLIKSVAVCLHSHKSVSMNKFRDTPQSNLKFIAEILSFFFSFLTS